MIEEMMLNRSKGYYDSRGAGNTAREIAQQPVLWRKLADYLETRRSDIALFMDKMEKVHGLRTVFTGAGSSAFIGESMQMLLSGESSLLCEAVHTTDIVASPESTLAKVPTLLVSYSRSGESPESIGALKYAKKRIPELYNMVFVCKADSSVSKYAKGAGDTLLLNMPPESCDLGFAMTSSISCMALATWCVYGYKDMDRRLTSIRRLADIAEVEMDGLDKAAQTAATWEFDRIVFLGCGTLRGLAREAAIKMLELTAGDVNSGWDTPTGFRHGPKSVVNANTVTVHLMSNLQHTRKYDDSLLIEVLQQRSGNRTIAVAPDFKDAPSSDLDVSYSGSDEVTGEIFPYIMDLLFVQMLALEKSMLLSKTTDNPAPGGQVNRVVKGIEVYPLD